MPSRKTDEPVPDTSAGAEAVDVQMADAEAEPEPEPERIIAILPGATDTAASFEFKNEDHTLGNALRHIILKNPQVEFCGYSIPHPAEQRMCLRIQTYDNANVNDVLEKGLDDLMDMCDVVIKKFEVASKDYHERKGRGEVEEFEGKLA